MTNVLLKLDYKGRSAGSILTDLPHGEAMALKNTGIGKILKEPKPEEEAPVKAEKIAKA